MTTVGIIQPSFIPWRGYFDFIREVDVFVVLDDVQYTPRDWRNRNRIRTRDGQTIWITVPVHASRSSLIVEVPLEDGEGWRRKHIQTLRHNYGTAPHVGLVVDLLEESYGRHTMLADLDIDLCRSIMSLLGITTPLLRSSDLGIGGVKDDRLLGIVRRLGGTRYLSGPSAKAYLQPALWHDAGIELAFKDYTGYPEYRQISEPFDPAVSVIDLIAMKGPAACDYLVRQPA